MGDKKTNSKKSKNKKKEPKNVPLIIKKIEKNMDEKFKNISQFLDINKKYSISFDKENNEIDVTEKNNKVFSATYDFYGIVKQNGQFYWSYMIPGVDRRLFKRIEKIKNLSYLFENSDHPDMLLFHSVLTQDSVFVNDEQMKKILALLLYLGGNIYFLHSVNSNGNIQLIFIKKITERFSN